MLQRLEGLLQNQKSLEKEVDRLKARVAAKEAGSPTDDVQTVNGISLLVKKVAVDSPTALRDLADRLRDQIGSGIVVLASAAGKKVLLVVADSDFEPFPGTPAVGRQVSLSASYRW